MPFGSKGSYSQYDDEDILKVTLSRLILREGCDYITQLPLINFLSENTLGRVLTEAEAGLLRFHPIYFLKNNQGEAFAYIPPVRDDNSDDETVIPPRLKDAICYYNGLIEALQAPGFNIHTLGQRLIQQYQDSPDKLREIREFLDKIEILQAQVNFSNEADSEKAPLTQALIQHIEGGTIARLFESMKRFVRSNSGFSLAHFTALQLRHNLHYNPQCESSDENSRYAQLVFCDSRSGVKRLWASDKARVMREVGIAIGGVSDVYQRFIDKQHLFEQRSCGAWTVRMVCGLATTVDSQLAELELTEYYNMLDEAFAEQCDRYKPEKMVAERDARCLAVKEQLFQSYPELRDALQEETASMTSTSGTERSDELPNPMD